MPLTTEAAARKDRRTTLADAPPRMTHRHFAYLATIVRETVAAGRVNGGGALDANNASAAWKFKYILADALQSSNPNFDRDRFLAAREPGE